MACHKGFERCSGDFLQIPSTDLPPSYGGIHFQEPCFNHRVANIRCSLKQQLISAVLTHSLLISLPETNIAPENGWLEYYFPIGEAYFQVLC